MQTSLVDMQWTALDFSTDPPAQRTFKVQFEEDEVTAEFKDIFDEGRELFTTFCLEFDPNIFRQRPCRAE